MIVRLVLPHPSLSVGVVAQQLKCPAKRLWRGPGLSVTGSVGSSCPVAGTSVSQSVVW